MASVTKRNNDSIEQAGTSETVEHSRCPYEPTEAERMALGAYFEKKKSRPSAPRMVADNAHSTPRLSFEHGDQRVAHTLLMQAVGTTDNEFFNGLLHQVANATSQGRSVDEQGLNFMLSVVKSVEPRDETEAMLAAQMAAVHMATMTIARRLANVENIPQQDSAERSFNKLARTFTAQLEALKRYRNGGQQKMTVEHVHVHEGGQAIVGNVEQGGGGKEKSREQPHAKPDADAPEPAMRSALEADGVPVPVTCDEEREV